MHHNAAVITIEDDAAPADPITIDDDAESNCDLQQQEVNVEDIEKMKVEEDDSDSEDALSASQPVHKERWSLIYTTSPCRLVSTSLGRSGMPGRTRPRARCLGCASAAVVVVSKIAGARQIPQVQTAARAERAARELRQRK
ncbi:hypothetical protein E4U31_004543 [Claviceps sp. LM219 group G6]|nr:hypothetical protein E4U31_004543 [Claviceps sp. LM219 group G6]